VVIEKIEILAQDEKKILNFFEVENNNGKNVFSLDVRMFVKKYYNENNTTSTAVVVNFIIELHGVYVNEILFMHPFEKVGSNFFDEGDRRRYILQFTSIIKPFLPSKLRPLAEGIARMNAEKILPQFDGVIVEFCERYRKSMNENTNAKV